MEKTAVSSSDDNKVCISRNKRKKDKRKNDKEPPPPGENLAVEGTQTFYDYDIDNCEGTLDHPMLIFSRLDGERYNTACNLQYIDLISSIKNFTIYNHSDPISDINNDEANCTICSNKDVNKNYNANIFKEFTDMDKRHHHISFKINYATRTLYNDGSIYCDWCLEKNHSYFPQFRKSDIIIDEGFGNVYEDLKHKLVRHVNITQVNNRTIRQSLLAYMKESCVGFPVDVVICLSPIKDFLDERSLSDIMFDLEEFAKEIISGRNTINFPKHVLGNTVTILPTLIIPKYVKIYNINGLLKKPNPHTGYDANGIRIWHPVRDFTNDLMRYNRECRILTDKLHKFAEANAGHQLFAREVKITRNQSGEVVSEIRRINPGPNLWAHGRRARSVNARNAIYIPLNEDPIPLRAAPDRAENLNNMEFEDLATFELCDNHWILPEAIREHGEVDINNDVIPDVQVNNDMYISELNAVGSQKAINRICLWLNEKNSLHLQKRFDDNFYRILMDKSRVTLDNRAVDSLSVEYYNSSKRIDIILLQHFNFGDNRDVSQFTFGTEGFNSKIECTVDGIPWIKPVDNSLYENIYYKDNIELELIVDAETVINDSIIRESLQMSNDNMFQNPIPSTSARKLSEQMTEKVSINTDIQGIESITLEVNNCADLEG